MRSKRCWIGDSSRKHLLREATVMRSRCKEKRRRGDWRQRRVPLPLHVRQVHQVSQAGQCDCIDAGAIGTRLPCCLRPTRSQCDVDSRPPPNCHPGNPEDGDLASRHTRRGWRQSRTGILSRTMLQPRLRSMQQSGVGRYFGGMRR